MRRLCFFILSFLAILVGYLIYIGWRDVVPSLGFIQYNQQLWHFFRHNLGDNVPLPDWMMYSLPQGLWAFGLSMCMGGIWYDDQMEMGYIWLTFSMLTVVLWEVFQSLGFISGTFCWVDVMLGICGVGVGFILFTFKKLES